MSALKIDTQQYGKHNYNIYQITDYTSLNSKVALSVAYGTQLKDNHLQYLEEELIKPFVTDMMDEMKQYEKVMVIVDISQFPIVAVSYVRDKEDLINDGTDIGLKMNLIYNEFTWENKRFPLIFVNMNISHTGLCIFDYENCKYIKN